MNSLYKSDCFMEHITIIESPSEQSKANTDTDTHSLAHTQRQSESKYEPLQRSRLLLLFNNEPFHPFDFSAPKMNTGSSHGNMFEQSLFLNIGNV